MTNKIMLHPLRLALMIFLLTAGVLLFAPSPAFAASEQMPDPADFTASGSVKLIVGNARNGQGIDARTAIVKIYSTNPTIPVSIQQFGQCFYGNNANNYDWQNGASPGSTTYEIYATAPDETVTGGYLPGGRASNGGTCTSDRTLTVTHPGSTSSRIGHQNYYVFEFRATIQNSALGWNGFSLSVPSGQYIGYSDSSGENFAIKPRFNIGDGPTYSTFTLRFAPACEVTVPEDQRIYWYDADQGEPNQLRTMTFDVIDDTTGQVIINDYSNLGGQNESRYRTITMQPGHKYRWVWSNVSSYNGIQFQMPYDSIYYNTDCNASPPGAPTIQPESTVNKQVMAFPDTATFTHQSRVTSAGSGSVRWTVRRTANGVQQGTPQSGTLSFDTAQAYPHITNNYTSSAGDEGKIICEQLTLDNPSPATVIIENNPAEACVRVAAEPYLKVFGGDISAGNGLSNSSGVCVNNNNAVVTSWNIGASSYNGAGAQYATFALNKIIGFSTAQSSVGALPPSDLAFANSSISAGTYGGDYGSLPCIPDYYASKPADAEDLAGRTLTALSVSGAYQHSGPLELGGVINPGNRLQLYVDGDVHITSNIVYPGSWTVENIPLFELVVRGNIYVSPGVSQLDGVYVARPLAAGGKGNIYTCSPNPTPYLDENAPEQLYDDCNNRLVINGVFVANQVQFLRTSGTLGASTGDSPLAATSGAAEQFNFNPTLWIAQPVTTPGGSSEYDAVTTLPPIL